MKRAAWGGMTGSTRSPLTTAQAAEMVADPWRVIADRLAAAYNTGSMVRGGEFVAKIIDAAEEANHHPDIDLRYGTVHLVLTTHSATEADVALANRITGIAADLGLEPASAPVTQFNLSIDALDIPAIRPFWKAVLGYGDATEREPVDLVDPAGRLPKRLVPADGRAAPATQPHARRPVDPDRRTPRASASSDHRRRTTAHRRVRPGLWVLADAEGNEVLVHLAGPGLLTLIALMGW